MEEYPSSPPPPLSSQVLGPPPSLQFRPSLPPPIYRTVPSSAASIVADGGRKEKGKETTCKKWQMEEEGERKREGRDGKTRTEAEERQEREQGKVFSHKELKYKDVVDFILENQPS